MMRIIGAWIAFIAIGCDGTQEIAQFNQPETKVTCSAGMTNCGGLCVDTKIESRNCGACGHICPNQQVCHNGSCVACAGGVVSICPPNLACAAVSCICLPGETQCGNICADLAKDENNCGACAHACAAGKVCSTGVCATAATIVSESYADGEMTLHFLGTAGAAYQIQASTDLHAWIVLTTISADPSGAFSFVDVDAASYPVRFYRAALDR